MTNQESLTKQDLLSNFALRLASNDQFMASVIRKYQLQERLTLKEFIDVLGISESQLSLLSLCRRPDPESEEFESQVKQLADYSGVNVYSLVSIIRQVDSLDSLSRLPKADLAEQNLTSTPVSPALAAARDRSNSEKESATEEDTGTNDDTTE